MKNIGSQLNIEPKLYSSFDSKSSIEGQNGDPHPDDHAIFNKAMQHSSEGQDLSDSAGACNTAFYERNHYLIPNQGQQDDNGSPILYATLNQAPSNQEIDVSIKNSGSTFESRFQNLTPQQQAQVKEDLANFTAANDKAMAALQNVGVPPKLEHDRLQESGYIDSYLNDVSSYLEKANISSNAVKIAIDDGMKLMDTMNSIDPELAKTCPDLGENLMKAMQQVGRAPAEIQQVATAFGISDDAGA